jgi:hypothetical protein
MGEPRQPEWLEAGPRPPSPRPPPWRRWSVVPTAALLTVVVAAAGALFLDSPAGQGDRDTAPQASTVPPTPLASTISPGPPVVSRGPQLADAGRWELYGRSETEVVRLELRSGRMTRTPVPPLSAEGPVSFLPTGTGILVRPVRGVAGYEVPDGRVAQPLPAALGRGGVMLPGPQPDQVWISGTSRFSSRGEMLLASLSAGWVRVQASLPATTIGPVQSDGAGSYYVGSTGGTYVRVPGGYRRISTGTVLAASRGSLLTAECDQKLQCRHLLVDRRTGSRRPVRLLPTFDAGLALVSLSPDARYAAVAYRLGTQSPALHLIDLRTGADREVVAGSGAALATGSVAWSPTSDYLAVVGAQGRLLIVATATAENVPLGAESPTVAQVASAP